MNVPNYEVGRLAALTVRMVMASGLSREEARAALGPGLRHDGWRPRARGKRAARANAGGGQTLPYSGEDATQIVRERGRSPADVSNAFLSGSL